MDFKLITEEDAHSIITASKIKYERAKLVKKATGERNKRVAEGGVRGLYIDGKTNQSWSKFSQFADHIKVIADQEQYTLIQVDNSQAPRVFNDLDTNTIWSEHSEPELVAPLRTHLNV